ncbi:MAG: pitrilysin family protein [Polyangiaceae bacterium]|jgi:zinc protease
MPRHAHTRSSPWLAVAAAALVSSLSPGARAQSHIDVALGPIEEHHLDNGLTLVIQEDHRVPLVSLAIRYDVAAAPPGQHAVATLTSFLMLGHTQHVAPGEYYRLLAGAGATGTSDRTQASATTFQTTVPSNRLALPLWLWSEQMGYFDGALDEAQLALQRNKLREQRRVAFEGSPLGRIDELAIQELYPPEHPYHFVEFTPEEVDHVDRAAVLAFHDAWITPPHATLVIVGDVVPADAQALVEKYFATIPRGTTGHGAAPGPLGPTTGETQLDVEANVPRAQVFLRYRTPRLLTLEDARLDIVARLLGGSRTAWLFWKLVDEQKIATNVMTHQRSDALASQFEIQIEGAPGKTAQQILAAFDATMDGLRQREPTKKELAGAIYETVIDRFLSEERAPTRAFDFARTRTLAESADPMKHDLGRYGRVDAGHVRDAIERFLPRERRVVLLVTPTPGAPAGGARVGRRVTQAPTP